METALVFRGIILFSVIVSLYGIPREVVTSIGKSRGTLVNNSIVVEI